MPVKILCVVCGSNFWVSPSKVNRYKTCSKECKGKYFSALHDGLNTGKTESRECLVCGKEFKVWKSRSKRSSNSGKCCSTKCHAQYKKIALDEDEIARFYKEGKSLNQIAKQMGVTAMTILHRLDAMNIKRRSLSECNSGILNPMFGKTHTEEIRQKIREANQKQFENPVAREKHGILTAKQISEGRTGKKHNSLECKLAEIIRSSITEEFVTQYRIGKYVFDFFIPKFNLLIEADGTFWHADPRKYHDRSKLRPVQIKNLENDKKKNVLASEKGYKLCRVWEIDVFNNPSKIVEIIRTAAPPQNGSP